MSSMRTIPAGSSRIGTGAEPTHTPAANIRRPVDCSDTDVVSNPSPPSAPWKGFLDIRLNNGPVSRRMLTESHVVIGRIPGVQLLLDHHTVSRRHAEMFCDPFGRWWIRDLGSTNGTLVNDEPVNEKVLQPSDKIAIGDFTLAFYVEPRTESRTRKGTLTVEDDKPTAIRTLMDFDPPRLAAEHLHILMEFSRRLINVEDPAERLGVLCQLMVQNDFHGSLAMALKVRNGTPTMLSRPYRPGGAFHPDEQPYISRRVLSKLYETREPVLAGNLVNQGGGNKPSVELTMSRDVMALWVVACPLDIQDDEMDVLYVTLPPEFGSVEWLSLISLAVRVFQQSEESWTSRKHAQAHAAIERELDTARQIQRALVPKKQDFSGLDISIAFEPCKWVGGDYVDALPMSDGRILFAVADVCGKGLQAALITSSLHTMVHATADGGRSLPELMERVNRYLCEWLPTHSFVTMIAVAIDPVTGATECVNAGHPPPIVASPKGSYRYMQSGVNAALGIAPTTMESQHGTLEHGEVLAMYTDGLTELRNMSKDMLGLDRLSEGFARICAASEGQVMNALANGLNQMLESFRGDQLPEDDRAFLLARRL
jgi:pSer/pThr/pTyr-binding forkhead associated (FHA) protein